MKNEYNRIFVNKLSFSDERDNFGEVYLSQDDAKCGASDYLKYDFTSKEYVSMDKINTVIHWCQTNIEDQAEITPFCIQVRDFLLNI